jgi:hypothetical protein
MKQTVIGTNILLGVRFVDRPWTDEAGTPMVAPHFGHLPFLPALSSPTFSVVAQCSH